MKNVIATAGNPQQAVDCPRVVPVCVTQSGILDSIGNTPLIRLNRASQATGCEIYGKAEFMNPGGSIKDRIAKAIVEHAEATGLLHPDSVILEVTSGNTGIALSLVGSVKGYKVRILMPKTVSAERRHMIGSFGAELVLIEEINRILDAVADSERMAAEDDRIFLPRQFSNPVNALCHERTTGPEIILQMNGGFDAFVMGVGTGGTVMGVGRAIRSAGIDARIVALEPDESAVMSGEERGCHGIQGLADGFIPDLVNLDEIDQVVRIKTAHAHVMREKLGREEGLLVGISSGANVLGAMQVARELGPGHTIVTVLADRGERYLSLAGAGM
jgi:cysteine synthase A